MYTRTFVGLDLSKNTIAATAKSQEGRRLDQSVLSSSDELLVNYLKKLPGEVHVVMEACNVWEHVYDAASQVAASVSLAHPYKTRVISEASLKSDKVDSDALAELLRLNAVPLAYAPDQKTRELRQLVRDRYQYKKLGTSVKNHIYSVLLRKGIPYEPGILGFKRKREGLRSLRIPAVDRGLDMLAAIESTCAESDGEIHKAFLASREAQLLSTIPGIGELTAVVLVAEICPVDRFPNVDKLCSYAGLVPTNYQSGDVSYQGRIKRQCSGMLKSILIEAAWAHRRMDKRSDVSKKGRRVARRRGKGKGNVAAAHKLLRIVYAVLKRGTPYTPERPGCVPIPEGS